MKNDWGVCPLCTGPLLLKENFKELRRSIECLTCRNYDIYYESNGELIDERIVTNEFAVYRSTNETRFHLKNMDSCSYGGKGSEIQLNYTLPLDKILNKKYMMKLLIMI